MTDPETVSPACSLIEEKHIVASLKADKGSDAHLTSWRVKTFTKREDNLTSIVVSVDVTFTLNGCEDETTYVVKTNPCLEKNEYSRFTQQVFVKESRFLTELGPELSAIVESVGQRPLGFPSCFYSSTEMGREIIVMNDLRRRGFRTRSKFLGMDAEHSTLVVQQLGRIHAASFILQEKMHNEKLADKFDFLKLDWVTYTGPRRQQFVDMFAEVMTNAAVVLEKVGNYERVIEWLGREKASGMDVMEEQISTQYPFQVLCHGDCWSNNLMFRYEGEVPVEVAVIDMQMVRVASPGTELSNFLYTSLEDSVRKANLETFLRRYHESFANTVAAAGFEVPFSLGRLMEEYRKKIKYGMYFAIMDIPLTVTDASDVPSGDDFMDKWRRKAIETLPSNPSLQSRFLSVFDDMIKENIID